jgi:membrane protein implicated in regulation of membrane protease activity
MQSIRETYDLPRKPPATFRFIGFLAVFIVGAPLLWLVLPDGPVTVAVLAIFFLVVIAVAIRAILGSRELTEPPGRNPVSTRPQ